MLVLRSTDWLIFLKNTLALSSKVEQYINTFRKSIILFLSMYLGGTYVSKNTSMYLRGTYTHAYSAEVYGVYITHCL